MVIKSLYIEETSKTPEVDFNAKKGVLSLTGRSIPEAPMEFYSPLYEWIEKYLKFDRKETILLEIKLEYYNSASSKCLVALFNRFERIANTNKKVLVNWYYEDGDDDMEAAGEDYQALISLPINLVKVVEIL